MSTILVIPDLHIPYNVPEMHAFLKEIKKETKPDKVVFLGDIVDQYAFSRFNKDPDALTPTQELCAARAELGALFKLFPEADLCMGNHEMRLYKRARDVGIPFGFLRTIRELLNIPEAWNVAESFTHEGILFTHGDGSSGRYAAFNLINRYRTNIVIGHLHGQASVVHLNNGIQTNWAMVCGCLVDPQSIAVEYGKHSTDKPVLMVGLITEGNPSLIPFWG